MSIATLAFFSFVFSWNICFYSFIFNMATSFHLKWISYRQHIDGLPVFIYSATLCFLVEFSLVTFRNTDRYILTRASQVVLVVKNPPANAGDERDVGSIPGWEIPLGGGNCNPLLKWLSSSSSNSTLALRIPWIEELSRLQSMGSQRVRHDWSNLSHTYTYLLPTC